MVSTKQLHIEVKDWQSSSGRRPADSNSVAAPNMEPNEPLPYTSECDPQSGDWECRLLEKKFPTHISRWWPARASYCPLQLELLAPPRALLPSLDLTKSSSPLSHHPSFSHWEDCWLSWPLQAMPVWLLSSPELCKPLQPQQKPVWWVIIPLLYIHDINKSHLRWALLLTCCWLRQPVLSSLASPCHSPGGSVLSSLLLAASLWQAILLKRRTSKTKDGLPSLTTFRRGTSPTATTWEPYFGRNDHSFRYYHAYIINIIGPFCPASDPCSFRRKHDTDIYAPLSPASPSLSLSQPWTNIPHSPPGPGPPRRLSLGPTSCSRVGLFTSFCPLSQQVCKICIASACFLSLKVNLFLLGSKEILPPSTENHPLVCL